MFQGADNIRGHKEKVEMTPEQVEEYAKCQNDIFHFAKYFYILTPKGSRPIPLREYQIREIKTLCAKVEGKNNRIIMQGRQSGKTTIATLYLTWKALFEEDKTIAILANKLAQALEIMARIRDAYIRLPLWLQQGIDPQRGGWSKSCIGLDNGTKIFAAASSSSSIRGKSVNYMLVDEFAHLDDSIAEDFIQSVMPVQTSDPDAELILISTPNGMNHFADIWQKAVAGENSYIPCKVQWWEIEGRDEAWKARVIRDYGVKHFAQEYSCPDGHQLVKIRRDGVECVVSMEELASMLEHQL
jgi:hypothetical protein